MTFGGDVEEEQANTLAKQMTRSIGHQLQTASEEIAHISWIETDGSKHIESDNELAITRFELILKSGKVYTLEGPVINMKIQN